MGFVESLLSAGIIALGGWIISIDRKVTKQETLREVIETKFDAVEQRLDRIERVLNGKLRN